MSLRILVVAGLLNGTTFFTSPDDRDGAGSTGTAATSAMSTATATDAPRDARSSRCRDQDPAGSDITLVTDDEPGDRLVVDGRVLGKDRVTPVRNAKVYVFHTDAAGYYSEHRGMDNGNPRICGILRTDEQGRYRFTTVRPGRYATGGPAPHVHYEVTPPGAKTRIFTLTFEAEPSGVAMSSEPWATSRPMSRDGKGAWHCTRDLWLQ
jgi:protocatechuate 3,4-dioxygenase beta subunit